MNLTEVHNHKGLREIITAFNKERINRAIREGFLPLIRKVEPSPEIRSKFCIIKKKQSGEIDVIHDARALNGMGSSNDTDIEIILDWTYYYPHQFRSPFAAYLIPADIKKDELVFVPDLIEDYVGAFSGQGHRYRLKSAEAIWNGSDLDILYDPKINRSHIVG